jgi:hypothetical protein
VVLVAVMVGASRLEFFDERGLSGCFLGAQPSLQRRGDLAL